LHVTRSGSKLFHQRRDCVHLGSICVIGLQGFDFGGKRLSIAQPPGGGHQRAANRC